jgi:methionyl-tRNA formyltransferase
VAETAWEGRQLRIWEAIPVESDRAVAASPGTVVATGAAGIDVATGQGALRLLRVQVAGRKAMTAAEFLNAHRLEGAVLGS